jgi:16S rRNA (cytosine1402-N4)-methyltransferase
MKIHKPVLLRECIEIFSPNCNKNYLDCTFGLGGHSRMLLQSSFGKISLIGIDVDPNSLKEAKKLTSQFSKSFIFYNIKFSEIDLIKSIFNKRFDGILFDLGVSTYQLKDPKRGFSFSKNSCLNMRLDSNKKEMNAMDFLKKSSKNNLIKVIREYAEDKNWKNTIKKILIARKNNILKNPRETIKFLSKNFKTKKPNKIHPLTNLFRGIRMFINNELLELEVGLQKSFKLLKKKGILIIISFNSIEDRIVKNFMKKKVNYHDQNFFSKKIVKQAELMFKKPITPSKWEIKNNVNSRSAKMRVLIKN